MRLIGTLSNEHHARQFVAAVSEKGIDITCEMSFDAPSGHMAYAIWVHDEDRIAEVAELFTRFQREPEAPEFRVATPPLSTPIQTAPLTSFRRRTPVTLFFLILCALVFLLNQLQELSLDRKGLPDAVFRLTPLQEALLFDVPPPLLSLEQLIQKLPSDAKRTKIPPELAEEMRALKTAPYWRGAYDLILRKVRGEDEAIAKGPLFERIAQGEVWRLFSPALLHNDFLHILFNMIWLFMLGRPIEERIGPVKTLGLTLVLGVGSNIAQYLMGGPLFLGYSGIVLGLAAFTWSRERIAPWEGYPLHRSTILFLILFVLAMAALQLASFLMLTFTNIEFSPNIANTAHIAGALLGAALGRFSLFAWKVRKP